jgi:hypothetical protein
MQGTGGVTFCEVKLLIVGLRVATTPLLFRFPQLLDYKRLARLATVKANERRERAASRKCVPSPP